MVVDMVLEYKLAQDLRPRDNIAGGGKEVACAHRDYGGVFPRLFEGRDKCPVPGRNDAPK